MEVFDFRLNSNLDLKTENTVLQGETLSTYDYMLVDNDDLRFQIAFLRIKSIKSNFFDNNVGSDLEELLGFPPVDQTNNYFSQKVIEALTFDNYFSADDIYIELVNQNTNNVFYKVYIKTLDGLSARVINVNLDLTQNVDVTMEI